MKREVAEKWCEALRSGDYQQGRNRLRDGVQHCCLGVLCEMALVEGVDLAIGHTYGSPEVRTYDGDYLVLPPRVMSWAGMKTDSGVLDSKKWPGMSLLGLNDHGERFTDIAKIIEEEWESL